LKEGGRALYQRLPEFQLSEDGRLSARGSLLAVRIARFFNFSNMRFDLAHEMQ